MKVITKKLCILAISALMIVSTTFHASAVKDGWINSGRWWYQNADKSYKANEWSCIDGKWYHFDREGWMQTGWFQDKDSKWYYLDDSGAMQTASKYINSLFASKSPAPNTPPANPSAPEKEAPEETPATSNAIGFNTQKENEVIQLVNKERAAQGLSSLGTNAKLTEAARIRAKEIVNLFDHNRPSGKSFSTVFSEVNLSYRMVGENIAEGYPSPAQVMNGWMNSAGHRANILKNGYTKIGVACYELNGRDYWVQLFMTE